MEKYYLTAQNDSTKSFYNKALVVISGNKKQLFSYNTLVAEIINNKPVVYNIYSATTLRHIKEFLLQNGFEANSKKQIIYDYLSKQKWRLI